VKIGRIVVKEGVRVFYNVLYLPSELEVRLVVAVNLLTIPFSFKGLFDSYAMIRQNTDFYVVIQLL
jgi:hypothetical protein